jgi:hypothetical protein
VEVEFLTRDYSIWNKHIALGGDDGRFDAVYVRAEARAYSAPLSCSARQSRGDFRHRIERYVET